MRIFHQDMLSDQQTKDAETNTKQPEMPPKIKPDPDGSTTPPTTIPSSTTPPQAVDVDPIALAGSLLEFADSKSMLSEMSGLKKKFSLDVDSLIHLARDDNANQKASYLSQLLGRDLRPENEQAKSENEEQTITEKLVKVTKAMLGLGAMVHLLEKRVQHLEGALTQVTLENYELKQKHVGPSTCKWGLPRLRDVSYPRFNVNRYAMSRPSVELSMFNPDVFFYIRREVLQRFKGTRESSLWTWLFKILVAVLLRDNIDVTQVTLAMRPSAKYLSPDKNDKLFLDQVVDILARLICHGSIVDLQPAKHVILTTMQAAIMDVHRNRSELKNSTELVVRIAHEVRKFPIPYDDDAIPSLGDDGPMLFDFNSSEISEFSEYNTCEAPSKRAKTENDDDAPLTYYDLVNNLEPPSTVGDSMNLYE